MPRDYKHTGKNKRGQHKPVAGWVWMLAGLSIGLLVALLVYLSVQNPAQHRAATVKTAAPETQRKAHKPNAAKTAAGKPKQRNKASTAHGTSNGVRYEFYTLLPESEVVIPDQELAARGKGEKRKTKPPGSYMLQAGSFRQAQEAKTLKGELALLGVIATIQNVTLGGDTWYRVRIGPFETFEEINHVRMRLRKNNINAIPVQIKG